jgi:hypothetical protein
VLCDGASVAMIPAGHISECCSDGADLDANRNGAYPLRSSGMRLMAPITAQSKFKSPTVGGAAPCPNRTSHS